MSDEELRALIDELKSEERDVSYRRRLLHGKIDLLRAELVNRLRTKHEAGDTMISGGDVQASPTSFSARSRCPPRRARRGLGWRPFTAPNAASSTRRGP